MEYIALNDICDVRDGTHDSPKYVQEGFPLVTSKNVVDGKLDLSTVNYITQEDYDKINERSKVDEGDIIMPMIGTIGNPLLIEDSCEFAIKNVALIKFSNKKICNKYIWYFLKSGAFKKYVDEKNKGGTQKFLSLGDIRGMKVPILEYSEQISVVEKFDAVCKVISERNEELQLLDNLIKARFVEMFGDPNDTKRVSDSRHKIGELCDVTKLAGFEFTEYINYQDSGEIIMLRGLNCKQGKLVLDNVKYIDRETSNKLPRSRLYVGDILMTYAGTIGDVAMVDEDDKYHLAPNVAKISIVAKDMLNPTFLVHLFMYSHDYIMTFASQVAQASINMQKIRDFEYIIPSMEEQIEFEQFANQVNKSKVAVQKTLEQTQTLFDSLMQKYFG